MGSSAIVKSGPHAAMAWIVMATATAVVGCSGNAPAPVRPKLATAPEAKVSAEARGALERMTAFLGAKKGFALRQTSTTTASDADLAAKVAGTMQHVVRVERPARVVVALTGDRKGSGTVASDGTTLVVHDMEKNRWESSAAPETLSAIVAHPLVAGMLAIGGGDTVNRAFFAENPVDALLEGVREMEVVGTESIDGRECTHLAAKTEGSGWDLWIAAGDEPVPVKFEPKKSQMRYGGADVDVATTVTFDEWRFDPAFTIEEFVFTPPEGAERVDSIVGAADEERRQRTQRRPSLHATVGFPAPKAQLVGLEGERFDPAAQKEKVVVLDFWATWCGPCRVSLPVVARVCKDYAGKGVVFRAVNLKEDAETIKTFLAEEPIDGTVVMDSTGDVSAAYRVEAIPHTVVIGGDGVVQAVHVGTSDDLEAKLRKQLDAILEGKSLVPKGGNQARAEAF